MSKHDLRWRASVAVRSGPSALKLIFCNSVLLLVFFLRPRSAFQLTVLDKIVIEKESRLPKFYSSANSANIQKPSDE